VHRAVGMEADTTNLMDVYDRAKQTVRWRPTGLRFFGKPSWRAGRGGRGLIGVSLGVADKSPIGAAFNKALTFNKTRSGGTGIGPLIGYHTPNAPFVVRIAPIRGGSCSCPTSPDARPAWRGPSGAIEASPILWWPAPAPAAMRAGGGRRVGSPGRRRV
jgi:hypothetical protein